MAIKRFKANKLGRDNIHDLFKAWDITSYERELLPEEFKGALLRKLSEETLEVLQARDNEEFKEEIADVLEVLHALADLQKIAWSAVEATRLNKQEKKGGYDKRLLIEYIEMDETNPRLIEFRSKPEKFPEIL